MKYIIKAIVLDMSQILSDSLISILVVAIMSVIITAVMVRNKRIGRYISNQLGFIVFLNYSYIILVETILSRHNNSVRNPLSLFINNPLSSRAEFIYSIENIMLFIPIGIVLPLAMNKLSQLRTIVWITLLWSLSIELSQLVLKRGFFQLSDLVMNTLGGAIGYIILCLIIRLKRVVTR